MNGGTHQRERVRGRLRVAEGLAFVAVVASLVGAVGPAERLSTTYSWPPAELAEARPSRVWYAPLLLSRRFPQSIAATLPCTTRQALADAERPVTVLATARSPEHAGGLVVRDDDGRLVVGVGDTLLAYLPLAVTGSDAAGCSYRLTIADRRWSVEGRRWSSCWSAGSAQSRAWGRSSP